jgi:hypothetical protein
VEAAIGDAWLIENPRWILAQTWQERGTRWKSGTRPCGTRNNKQTNKPSEATQDHKTSEADKIIYFLILNQINH